MPRANGSLGRKRMRDDTQVWVTIQTVKIEKIKAKQSEGLVELLLYQMRLMSIVPELGRDEELLALDDGRNYFLQSTANLFLVLINHRKVEMTISVANSDFDLEYMMSNGGRVMLTTYRFLHLTGFGQPSTEPNSRKLVSIGQSDRLAKRHGRDLQIRLQCSSLYIYRECIFVRPGSRPGRSRRCAESRKHTVGSHGHKTQG